MEHHRGSSGRAALEHFERTAARRGFVLDPAQRAAAVRLAGLAADLRQPVRRHLRGQYLYGPVGRGKSFLLDAFFGAVPIPGKIRVHFPGFFDRLRRTQAVGELIGDARLVCFDEFHLHDPDDAALLTRLLRVLRERRVTCVTTSNYHPDGLLPNPLHHHLARPAIDLIGERFDLVPVAGPTDYRTVNRRGRFAEGAYFSPARSRGRGLETPGPGERTTVCAGDRRLRARTVRDRLVWFDFAELCERPTSARDYLALADRFDTWVLGDVPRLAACTPDARQRFANLVDILCDQDITLFLVGAHEPEEVLAGARDTIDGARTASRLALLAGFTEPGEQPSTVEYQSASSRTGAVR
ncbi:cell division protein ZapE [Amycolatopsis anabasis]|uniref:cell division protein ZapE n=1 Tax=Amycolatopsis anabasis TaxID=1840409 RepID=UPI00131CEC9F|nr:cell division protein ZapE [Amycolatopsis anabasis]